MRSYQLREPLITLSLSIVALTVLAQETFERSGGIGLRPDMNQCHVVFKQQIDSTTGIYAEVGYQMAFDRSFERFSRIQVGLIPRLSSYGPAFELGYFTRSKKHDLYIGLQYRYLQIDFGKNFYAPLVGLQIEEDSVSISRVDHLFTFRGRWVYTKWKYLQPYLGIGVRGVYALNTIIESSNPSHNPPRFQIWGLPTLHFGLIFYPLNWSF